MKVSMFDAVNNIRFFWDFETIPSRNEAIQLDSIRAFVTDIIADVLIVECLCTAAELNETLVLKTYQTQKPPTVEDFTTQSRAILSREL